MLQVYHLTSFIGDLTTALDNPTYADISVEEVAGRIEDRSVLEYLATRFVDSPPLTSFGAEVGNELVDMLQGMLSGYPPPERINGIRNSGLCLLIAYAVKRLGQEMEIAHHELAL